MITDELRKYASGFAGMLGVTTAATTTDVKDDLEEIADRIDAQHEECAGFCRRLEDAAKGGEEVTIFGTDYVPLPTDADGIPFHVGDHVQEPGGLPDEGLPPVGGTIERMVLRKTGWLVRVYAGGKGCVFLPENVRHYHAPTVEDVLQKLLEQAVGHSDAHTTVALNTIAEYAAKLRLAGDAE